MGRAFTSVMSALIGVNLGVDEQLISYDVADSRLQNPSQPEFTSPSQQLSDRRLII